MSVARLRVEQAGPLTTVQDGGRRGWLRFGVPASGPVDRLASSAANAAAGNAAGAPAIELSHGGLSVSCVEGRVAFALTGGDFGGALDEQPARAWISDVLEPGSRLLIRPGMAGNWGYLALAGRLQTPTWLGSAATHALAGLGGGRLTAGDLVTVLDANADAAAGPLPLPPQRTAGRMRLVLGPHDRFFETSSLVALVSDPFAASGARDRMGMVLDGPRLLPKAVDMISEPLVRGALQVDGDGVATVLLADHQTTGGYPRIATLLGHDADAVAQLRPGAPFRFQAVEPAAAVEISRAWTLEVGAYLRTVRHRASLGERLLQENLISGVYGGGLR
jgi:biotin-dependent carboxylase-like uncharacterized protein